MAPIQSSASVAATGLGLRYIGDFVYAFSKPVGVADTETSLIDTTSGSGLIKCDVVFQYVTQGNHDFQYRIYLNDLVVFNQFLENIAGDNKIKFLFAIPLIIPPFTEIKCTAQNITAGDSETQAVSLVGRVYGAE